ncbi:hypothetical protein BUZ14_05645 [Staphylococcus gallinarum]|uniref:Uncharacterized protein n=1 Tax=Staphylococcus gallinarum TaxID=1293 RepID=A0A3A0VQW1_STAGA|nr:hypothetical protein [Staphylococcus gallinarum]RIP36134.1 hypothetical protein BUZ14_05645 [Staphylococcus gallinarum]
MRRNYNAQYSELLYIFIPVILIIISNLIDRSSYHLLLIALYIVAFGYVVIRKLISTVQAIGKYRYTRQPVFITVVVDFWIAFTVNIAIIICIIGITYTIMYWQWPVNIIAVACIAGMICLMILIVNILGKHSFVFSDDDNEL